MVLEGSIKLYKGGGGSESESQDREMLYNVGMSNMPLGVGLNLELIAMLRKYLAIAGWETGDISHLIRRWAPGGAKMRSFLRK